MCCVNNIVVWILLVDILIISDKTLAIQMISWKYVKIWNLRSAFLFCEIFFSEYSITTILKENGRWSYATRRLWRSGRLPDP